MRIGEGKAEAEGQGIKAKEANRERGEGGGSELKLFASLDCISRTSPVQLCSCTSRRHCLLLILNGPKPESQQLLVVMVVVDNVSSTAGT